MAEENKAPEAEETKAEETKAEETAPAEAEATETKEESKEVDTSNLSKNATKVLEMVEKMSILELADLVKVMEEKFGVTAAAPVAVAAGGAAGGGEEEAAEKTDFDVEITSAGSSKIGVIKVVKEVLGVGLKEAKDLVDGAPKVIKEKAPKDEAEELKSKLEEAGASVTLK